MCFLSRAIHNQRMTRKFLNMRQNTVLKLINRNIMCSKNALENNNKLIIKGMNYQFDKKCILKDSLLS